MRIASARILIVRHALPAAAVIPQHQTVAFGGIVADAVLDELLQVARITRVDLAQALDLLRGDGAALAIGAHAQDARIGPVAEVLRVLLGAVDEHDDLDALFGHARLDLVEVDEGCVLQVVVGRHVDHERPVGRCRRRCPRPWAEGDPEGGQEDHQALHRVPSPSCSAQGSVGVATHGSPSGSSCAQGSSAVPPLSPVAAASMAWASS